MKGESSNEIEKEVRKKVGGKNVQEGKCEDVRSVNEQKKKKKRKKKKRTEETELTALLLRFRWQSA